MFNYFAMTKMTKIPHSSGVSSFSTPQHWCSARSAAARCNVARSSRAKRREALEGRAWAPGGCVAPVSSLWLGRSSENIGKSSKIHKLNGAVWWEKIGKTVIHGHFNGKIIEQNGELSIAMFDSQTVAGLEWGSNLSIYLFGPVWICHINLPAINKISW